MQTIGWSIQEDRTVTVKVIYGKDIADKITGLNWDNAVTLVL